MLEANLHYRYASEKLRAKMEWKFEVDLKKEIICLSIIYMAIIP